MSEPPSTRPLINWQLANRARRVLACSVAEDPTGAFIVRVELQGEDILRECYYSEHDARQRAEALRSVLGRWADTA